MFTFSRLLLAGSIAAIRPRTCCSSGTTFPALSWRAPLRRAVAGMGQRRPPRFSRLLLAGSIAACPPGSGWTSWPGPFSRLLLAGSIAAPGRRSGSSYGSRFLLVTPFGYDREAPDHWYAWDIDSCWMLTVVGAGVFWSAEDALAEWQHAVGPAAGTALSLRAPETTARLLARCLETGPLSDLLQGSEPRELIREYYRLRRRA